MLSMLLFVLRVSKKGVWTEPDKCLSYKSGLKRGRNAHLYSFWIGLFEATLLASESSLESWGNETSLQISLKEARNQAHPTAILEVQISHLFMLLRSRLLSEIHMSSLEPSP